MGKMDWKGWNGKNVFIRTINNRVYSGKIINVDVSDRKLIWITLIDKFNNNVSFVHSEIVEIKEEKE